jgi:threonine/homoserine/homoserine lactone efflux protein
VVNAMRSRRSKAVVSFRGNLVGTIIASATALLLLAAMWQMIVSTGGDLSQTVAWGVRAPNVRVPLWISFAIACFGVAFLSWVAVSRGRATARAARRKRELPDEG